MRNELIVRILITYIGASADIASKYNLMNLNRQTDHLDKHPETL